MRIKQKQIKQTALTNNCPECFSNEGLLLTFYQKHIENAWYKMATSQITDRIKCQNCNTDIYPVRWTDDIERVREFYLKSIETPAHYFKLTRLAVITLLSIVVVGITVYVLLNNVI
ncbi:hypothetical protein [Galbibacter sp.]|uniref:hypothetical protein n=1 Tax=Galbibacter sp. TaxID=2918471 RepID=UPI002B997FC9|nr:hypothetical protein [Galbibacter sp.]HLV63912.1 hypothetical protein [Galbibacter sp.]